MAGDTVDNVRSVVLENEGEGGFGIPDNDIEVAPFVIFFLINRTRDVAFLSSQGGDRVTRRSGKGWPEGMDSTRE
jgi:hypothetical protein